MSEGSDRRRFLVAGAAAFASIEMLGGPRAAAAPLGQETSVDDGADPGDAPGIPPGVVEAAERLAGIEFTPEERRTIAETIGEQLEIFAARQARGPLPNELAPATVFRALLPGQRPQWATTEGRVRDFVPEEPGPLPADDAAIAFAPVVRLAGWIRRRSITSRRLTELCLRRLERFDPKLRCVITMCPDRARDAADRADAELAAGRWRGPLHGIPWGAKDIIDTAGIATTWGAETHRDRIAERNAVVVDRLDRAGAVLVAKLSVGALAYGDIWFGGRTNNPFEVEQGSSGSSAGSCSAVAAGLVPFALGTETLGSIVSPCVRCGTTGLRPTFGRVARTGCMALVWSMDKIGPIARTVADTALVLDAINGADDGDPSSVIEPLRIDPAADARGLQVGYDPSWFEGRNARLRPVLAALRSAGAELVELRLPEVATEPLLLPLYAEAAAAFEDLVRSDRDDELAWQAPEAWPNTFRRSWFLPAIELVQADRLRREAMERTARLFESVDAIVSPPFAGGILLLTNATGHPTLVQRAGFTKEGSPYGVTFTGRLFDEGTLVRLGAAVEKALGVSTRRPAGFDA
ncbi:MAG: amidase [Phycisphaerales bacterium]